MTSTTEERASRKIAPHAVDTGPGRGGRRAEEHVPPVDLAEVVRVPREARPREHLPRGDGSDGDVAAEEVLVVRGHAGRGHAAGRDDAVADVGRVPGDVREHVVRDVAA